MSANLEKQGRILTVDGSGVGAVNGFDTTISDQDVERNVTFQMFGGAAPPAGMQWQLEFWRGEAHFRTPFRPFTTANLKSFNITARFLRVSFKVVHPAAPQPDALVSVSVSPGAGGYQGPQLAQWVADAGDAHAGRVLLASPGRAFDGTVIVKTMPPGISPVWVLLFDQATVALVSGTTAPVPGGRSAGMFAAGDSCDLQVEGSPVECGAGFVWALSSTPDVYTDPGPGGVATIDLHIGA